MFCLRDTYSAEQDSVLSRVVRHAEYWELRPTRTRKYIKHSMLHSLLSKYLNKSLREVVFGLHCMSQMQEMK